jgi:hypothetical protein
MSVKRRSDGDKMKKVLLGAVAAIAVTGAANAQGQWYTSYTDWAANITGLTTANYNAMPALVGNPYFENGVTASNAQGFVDLNGALSTETNGPVTFTFGTNSFGGMFALTNLEGDFVSDAWSFTIDGNPSSLPISTSSQSGYSFLGYISDSASPLSVVLNSNSFVTVDAFYFGTGSNSQNPGGGGGNGAVPEPGTVVSMGLLGAGVLGLVVRSRRRISN